MTKSKEPKTHFEQVPLKEVKKIAKEDIPGDGLDGNDESDETPKEKS